MRDKLLNKLTYKNILWIITYTVLLVLFVVKLDVVLAFLSKILSLLTPFAIAFAFAFVFNLPMRFFLRKLPSSLQKGRKVVAVLLSLFAILGGLTFVVSIVVPQLVDSIKMLIVEFPTYVSSTQELAQDLMKSWGIDATVINQIDQYSAEIEQAIVSMASSILPQIVSITTSVISTLTNVVMGIVIAVYLTVSKEKLINQSKKALYAFLPAGKYNHLVHVVKLTNKTFSNFVSGQLVEAIIIGVLCYLGASLLRLEYAPILAVVIGCTNIIPIFGPIIGTGFGALLLLFVDPIQAIVFVVFGILLQQFESNLIYPRVVGNSVGLSGLWVLLAVSVGGGLFGIVGMVIGLPMLAVGYRLFADEVHRRLQLKKKVKQT